MRTKSLLLSATAIWLAAAATACAQFGHSDVDFGLDGNKIVTDKRVYDSFFPTFGISKQFSTNPGFAAESDGVGTLGSSHEVVYDLLSELQFWDGQQFAAPEPDVSIRIENNPRSTGSTSVNASSGEQLGSISPPANRIGAASAGGEVHAHVSFFLERDDEAPPIGAYGFKLAISTESEQILDSDPVYFVFNYGLDAAEMEAGLASFESLLDVAPPLAGDFDEDGMLDVDDIDLLTVAARTNPSDLRFDLNADNTVTQEDRRVWIEQLKSSYFGDANLDGEFASSDFVAVFQTGEYEDATDNNSTWGEGDWDGDGDFSTTDFVAAFQAGGYEQGPRAASAVPEPNGACLGYLAVLAGILIRHKVSTRGDSSFVAN